MGCLTGSSRSSSSASDSDHDPETSSRRRSPTTLPWIKAWAEALQSPRSNLSSNARYEDWVEQRAAYHRGEGPEDAAGRGDDASDTSNDLCDSQACRAPPGRRSPRTPRMFRAVEAHTRSCATAASSSDNDNPSDPHRTQGLQRCRSGSSRRPRRPSRPEGTSLDAWFEAQVALGLVTFSNSEYVLKYIVVH